MKNFQRAGQMRQILRMGEMMHPTIGWRRDEHGTHKHARGSWILWSVSRVRSKTMHSLSSITSWLPYITLSYIDSRFFLLLEQLRTALLGCRLSASPFRARLLVSKNENITWSRIHCGVVISVSRSAGSNPADATFNLFIFSEKNEGFFTLKKIRRIEFWRDLKISCKFS